ncbi:MAG: class I SAM-dependent methyltransferase [Steroidobacteraceae bacterium]
MSRRLHRHAMCPRLQHDDNARQDFVRGLRAHLSSRVMPGVYKLYSARAEPRFMARHGRKPQDEQEVRNLMLEDGYYQFWSALQRRSQELLWESVIEPLERDLPQLTDLARQLAASGKRVGTLKLNPALVIPPYHRNADIHLQPGGYHQDQQPDDIAAGAIYDAGINIYLNGALGTNNDLMGDVLVGFLRQRAAQFDPRRILDLGCAIGNSTLCWKREFPQAHVHGIDIGAPVLRYGHARAEALAVPIHFSQQNAEGTDFPDRHFDLVVSHIMLHETSRSAIGRIFRECHRLLRPGGMMLHLEIPRGSNPVERFMHNWESFNNNETFARFVTHVDWPAEVTDAGFPASGMQVLDYRQEISAAQGNYAQSFAWKIIAALR